MSSSDKNSDGIDIICSENNCYGTIYNPKDNTFTQITVKCSRKGCKIKRPNQCNIEEICQNCFNITLLCFNGHCIGGINTNEPQNSNSESNEDNTICNCDCDNKGKENNDNNNNEGINNENQNKESEEKGKESNINDNENNHGNNGEEDNNNTDKSINSGSTNNNENNDNGGNNDGGNNNSGNNNNNNGGNNDGGNNNDNNNNGGNNDGGNNNGGNNNNNNNGGNNNNEGNSNGGNNDGNNNNNDNNNNGGNNNNNNNNENNNNNNNHNNNTNGTFPYNETIIIISCQDDLCKLDEIDDIDGNNNGNGILCENKKCSFQPEGERRGKTPNDNTKNKEKNKKYIILSISCFWIICIIINFCIIFSCGAFNCSTCVCTCYLFYMLFFAIILAPFFIIYILICLCCKIEFRPGKKRTNNSQPNHNNNNPNINRFPRYFKERIPSEISTLRDIEKTEIYEKNNEEEKIKQEEKQIIIQKHSGFCEIEKIDEDYYLINNKEVEIIIMLYHSLKKITKKITIYTFNIAQKNLIEKNFEKELLLPKIILLNEDCTNFIFSDYTLISYIESEISEESKKKYPDFKSKLNSRKYYEDEFTKNILDKYTSKNLYLIANDEYLRKSLNDSDDSIESKRTNPIGIIAKEIQVPVINRDYVTNEYNICFIIDNTGSMSSWINIIKEICHKFFIEITEKYKDYKFYFACVLYGDKPSTKKGENFYVNFTQDEKKFDSELKKINLQGGGDEAEDWVSGFRIALEELEWNNGTKLIFHIADAPQHGKHFNIDKKNDNFLNDSNDTHGKNLLKLIKKCSEKNIKITGININNVASFRIFKEEYEKVDGPKYEIINIGTNELSKGNDFMNKKMFEIIEKSINQNKAEKFIN